MKRSNEPIPIVGITMGDPNGIGPEIAVKALACKRIRSLCRPFIIGDMAVIQEAITIADLELDVYSINSPKDLRGSKDDIFVLAPEDCKAGPRQYGTISAQAGHAAFVAIKKAVELATTGQIDAIVTAPIHKEALHASGCRLAGHTEILARLTKTNDYAMLLVYDRLRVVHVTTHVPIARLSRLVTCQRVLKTIVLGNEGCIRLGIKAPRIGVAGLNPHASDGGLFGHEEQRQIIPAIEKARSMGIDAQGPIPADTLFSKAVGGAFDLCVAMYHDQGHIAIKLIGFTYDRSTGRLGQVNGVNITLGLPIIRTSVDHGTAFDIAGKGLASPQSMIQAIEYATILVHNERCR